VSTKTAAVFARAAGATGDVGPDPEGDSDRDLVKPGAEGPGVSDGGSLAGQGEERSLPGVLHVRPAAKGAAAGPMDDAAVPPDEGLKGMLIAVADEAIEKFGVGRGGRLADSSPQRLHHAGR
jgi:hypothetical protein